MKITLVGYMGSGKTTVGKHLANALNLPFIDLDSCISKQYGASIPSIFSAKGEVYFRQIETQTLKELFENNKQFVLATGGGTPCYGNNMALILAQSVTVYLNVTPDVLCQRLFNKRHTRPLIAHLSTEDELDTFIKKHLFERRFFYEQAQEHMLIKNADYSAKDIARQLVTKVSALL